MNLSQVTTVYWLIKSANYITKYNVTYITEDNYELSQLRAAP